MRCAKAAGRKFTTDIWCELEMQAGTNIVYLAVFAASFWITPATRGIQNYIVNRITIGKPQDYNMCNQIVWTRLNYCTVKKLNKFLFVLVTNFYFVFSIRMAL